MPEARTPILAIDPGSTMGWALDDGVDVSSGVARFQYDDYAMRFLDAYYWLQERAPWHGVLAWEAQHHRGGAATQLGLGYQTVLQMVAHLFGCERLAVHTGTLKKWAAGSGRAGKAAMIAAARRLSGRDVTDDNEADAICLLYYAREAR